MKVWEVLTIILLILSGSIYIFLLNEHPKVSIGILMNEGVDDVVGISVEEGFKEYSEYIEAKILDNRFNDSDVRTKDGFKQISDHFRICPLDEMRKENDVDIILMITSDMIEDWDDNEGMGYWGKADPSYEAALITTYYWKDPTPKNIRIWNHLAIHEIMHMLGYTHNPWDISGVMQHKENIDQTDLVPYYKFQLPLRSSLYKLSAGRSFQFTVFIMSLAIASFMFPIAMAEEIIINRFHDKISGTPLPIWLSPLSLTGCFFLLFAVTGSFFIIAFTLIFTILVHLVYHVIVEGK
jgi:hypothetical protein